MNGQPSSPQAVVYNISNTNGNNYVNATPSEPQGQSVLQGTRTVRRKRELHHRLLLMINIMSPDLLTPLT